jgi:hypothetical protein
MQSSDSSQPEPTTDPSRGLCARLSDWNHRLHYLVGLFVLLFVWLFALSGLLLNHSKWKFSEFWETRRQNTSEPSIVVPAGGGDLAQARDIMKQLGIRGEIEWTVTDDNPNRFDFRVSRPGEILEIRTDLTLRKASVQQIHVNTWGVVRMLHTFTGVRADDSRNGRDWAATWLWVLAMDVVSASLVFMALSSFCMWYVSGRKRVVGAIVLAAGFLSCGFFCFALRWIFA